MVDVPCQKHPGAAERREPQPAKHTHVLPQLASTWRPNACWPTRAAANRIRSVSSSDDTLEPLSRLICSRRPASSTDMSSSSWPSRAKLAAALQAQEVRQPSRADSPRAGSVQQHAVDTAEPCWIVAEHGTREHIPAGAVPTGAV
jgi:hypothetical protein